MNRTVLIRAISFLLLATCGAWCQSETSSAELPLRLRSDGLNPKHAFGISERNNNVLSILRPPTEKNRLRGSGRKVTTEIA